MSGLCGGFDNNCHLKKLINFYCRGGSMNWGIVMQNDIFLG